MLYVDPKALPGSSYDGRGPMVLGSLLCTGDEESLTDCPRGRAGDVSCSRYNRIARVVCSNGKNIQLCNMYNFTTLYIYSIIYRIILLYWAW